MADEAASVASEASSRREMGEKERIPGAPRVPDGAHWQRSTSTRSPAQGRGRSFNRAIGGRRKEEELSRQEEGFTGCGLLHTALDSCEAAATPCPCIRNRLVVGIRIGARVVVPDARGGAKVGAPSRFCTCISWRSLLLSTRLARAIWGRARVPASSWGVVNSDRWCLTRPTRSQHLPSGHTR